MWIGIARVKNEGDIIEAFIRHSICHLDKLIVIDHASNDRTSTILDCLITEGMPLEVHRSDAFETQGDALTRLMRQAFSRDGADWVIPLDADEFLETEDGSLVRDGRPPAADESLELFWSNFMYVADGSSDEDVFSRMRWRSNVPSELPKVAIPRAIGENPRFVIYEGSHFVARRGIIFRGRPALDLTLCHFPIRTLDQYRQKVIIGTLRYLVNPSLDGQTWGWHYRSAFDLIVTDQIDRLETMMREESLRYSAKHPPGDPILKPFERLGGELRYTTASDTLSTTANLARFAEQMAHELQRLKAPRSLSQRLLDVMHSSKA